MKKINTSPISGMQELLPNLQEEFNSLKTSIMTAYRAHGFQTIETPTIERLDILLAKAGGETEKQIYKVIKTAETADDADQALRFDHTVPLARYTAKHVNELAFPFKVAQVGRNFRGERAQKGRFREFYQCDVDVIGRGELSIAYDAEVISTLVDAMRAFPLPSIKVRISNRKLLNGLLKELGLEKQAEEIFGIVDHAEKVPHEKTLQALKDLKIAEEKIQRILEFVQIAGKRSVVIEKLESLEISNETFRAGVLELGEVLKILEEVSAEQKSGSMQVEIVADMMIVRGLDYYTGTVFETIAPDYREIGSICSGGRYENLARYYTEQALPGVGGSIGLTRLFYVLRNYGLIKADEIRSVDICLVPLSQNEWSAAEKLAQSLRLEGHSIDVVLTEKKLGDKLNYAAKIAKYAIVLGENEIRTNQYTLKNLQTGEKSEFYFPSPASR